MGLFQSTESSLTSTELEEYQDCTFFTKKEILYVRLRNDINIVQQARHPIPPVVPQLTILKPL
jgi:hypothetical protein